MVVVFNLSLLIAFFFCASVSSVNSLIFLCDFFFMLRLWVQICLVLSEWDAEGFVGKIRYPLFLLYRDFISLSNASEFSILVFLLALALFGKKNIVYSY